jgi:hypothetical protein
MTVDGLRDFVQIMSLKRHSFYRRSVGDGLQGMEIGLEPLRSSMTIFGKQSRI